MPCTSSYYNFPICITCTINSILLCIQIYNYVHAYVHVYIYACVDMLLSLLFLPLYRSYSGSVWQLLTFSILSNKVLLYLLLFLFTSQLFQYLVDQVHLHNTHKLTLSTDNSGSIMWSRRTVVGRLAKHLRVHNLKP